MSGELVRIGDYPGFLEECWREHMAPKGSDAPTVISTFAGCGGSSLGYSMAGFRELLAVEWDDNAVACFRLNFPDVPVHHGDISRLSVEEVLAKTGLREGQLDVFDGSPPCQGFSSAGKRIFDDDRNQLFREYVRLLRGLKPRVFVMENVSGMVEGKMKLIFSEIMRELKASGYAVSARMLGAMWLGVPQMRERLIFVGVRSDLGISPVHPLPRTMPVTLREALAGVNKWNGVQAPHLTELKAKRWGETGRGSQHAERFSLKRLSWNRPANTMLKMPGSGGLLHPDEPREFHEAELKRIGSFPDSFRMVGAYLDVVGRLGNSVPPLMMREVAMTIRSKILAVANRQAA